MTELLISAAVAGLNLAVFGAHALLPFRLASADDAKKRLWAVLAPVVLIAACSITAWVVGVRPDEAIAWGMTHPLSGSMPVRFLTVAIAAAAVSDLVVLFAWSRLEPTAWRLHGAIGVVALCATQLAAELLRIGWGPWTGTAAILGVTMLRMPLALATAEIVTGPPKLWTTVAGPALFALSLLWPSILRRAMVLDYTTLLAAALLLVGARFVLRSLRRAAAVAGLLLALLFLARSAEISRTIGVHQEMDEFEVKP